MRWLESERNGHADAAQRLSGYIVGSPSSGTVTIVSDDVAPDFAVTALTAPPTAGAGMTVSVSDTTKNQGTGPSTASVTSFYLSTNVTFSSDDQPLGSRDVPGLAVGASSTGHDHGHDTFAGDARPLLHRRQS